MNSKFIKLKIAVALFAIGAMTQSGLMAQDKLPTADEVIAKYVKVTGGLAKYKAMKTLRQKGTIGIPMAGLEGEIEIKIASPDKFRSKAVIGGAGTEATGSDGKIAWAESTMGGPRLLEGKEKEQAMTQADFNRLFDPGKTYKSMEVTGIEKINGEDCYEMKIVKENGDGQTDYYSVESGLQTLVKTKIVSAMGDITVEISASDYKDVNGIKMPHKMTQFLVDQGMKIEITFDEIEINGEFDKGTFDLPKAIQKLADKKNEKDGE